MLRTLIPRGELKLGSCNFFTFVLKIPKRRIDGPLIKFNLEPPLSHGHVRVQSEYVFECSTVLLWVKT